jgi:hypothetical protein
MFVIVPIAVLNALILVFVPILLLMILRRQWLAVGLFFLLLGAIFTTRAPNLPIGPIVSFLQAAMWIYLTLRFGLLALAVNFLFYFALTYSPVTLQFGSWYAVNILVALLSMIVLILYAFRIALGGRPALGGSLLQDLDQDLPGSRQA